MTEIHRLEEKLKLASENLIKLREDVKANPMFSKEMELQSLISHVAQLEEELRFEKAKREKEFIELRLKGTTVNFGNIPLRVLAKISGNLSAALLNAATQSLVGGKRSTEIVNEVSRTIDLRLSGIGSGSTKLYITANTAPDLFGNSIIEAALENTFALFNSSDSQDLANNVSSLGKDSTVAYRKLMNSLITEGIELDMSWHSPSNKEFKWEGTQEKMKKLSSTLNLLEVNKPEIVPFNAELVTISLKGDFEIKDDILGTIKAKFPVELLKTVQQFTIGDRIQGELEKHKVVNLTTKAEKITYTLSKLL